MEKRIQRVILECDIILEVLDARDVNGTRSRKLENEIRKRGKQLILVINKCDLAKPKQLEDAIKISATKHWGTHLLRKKIHEITRQKNLEKIRVGVVGYPNTGKSSLINALGGRANISPRPGFTRGEQWCRISKKILLMDTPGIIPFESEKSLAIKAAIDITKLKDPVGVALELIKKIGKRPIQRRYNFKLPDNAYECLLFLAKKWNMLLKGGELDLERASRKLIKDWQTGRIRHL